MALNMTVDVVVDVFVSLMAINVVVVGFVVAVVIRSVVDGVIVVSAMVAAGAVVVLEIGWIDVEDT